MLIFIKKLDRRSSSNGIYKITYALFFCETCESYVEKPISYKGLLSCGCSTNFIYKGGSFKHGDSKKGKRDRLYNIWLHMKNRCLTPTNDSFHNYGGRGITVCPEWANKLNGYTNFRDWSLNNGYLDNLEIDRINNDGNYQPNNCQWLTREENKLKQRRNVLTLELANEIRELHNMKRLSIKEMAKKYKVGQRQIYYIINNKQWSI